MSKIKILKAPDDPICTRVSAGGREEIGYYLVYRGTPVEALKVIDKVRDQLSVDILNQVIHEKQEHSTDF